MFVPAKDNDIVQGQLEYTGNVLITMIQGITNTSDVNAPKVVTARGGLNLEIVTLYFESFAGSTIDYMVYIFGPKRVGSSVPLAVASTTESTMVHKETVPMSKVTKLIEIPTTLTSVHLASVTSPPISTTTRLMTTLVRATTTMATVATSSVTIARTLPTTLESKSSVTLATTVILPPQKTDKKSNTDGTTYGESDYNTGSNTKDNTY